MSLIVPQTGLDQVLNAIAGAWTSSSTIHLYQNNYTPVYGSVIGNFTEANYDGYSAQGFPGWTVPVAQGDGIHELINWNSAITFTSGTTLGNSIYGYYCLDGTGTLIFAELLPGGPFTLGTSGQSLSITVVFSDRSEF